MDANWDKLPWKKIQPQPIRLHMGGRPEHFPKAEVKIAYDEAALYLIFRVEDQFVLRRSRPSIKTLFAETVARSSFSRPAQTCRTATSISK